MALSIDHTAEGHDCSSARCGQGGMWVRHPLNVGYVSRETLAVDPARVPSRAELAARA